MVLRAIMPFAGALTAFIDFLFYASPSAIDQLSGKLIMLFGGLMVATVVLPSTRGADVARKIMIAPILLFLGYCALHH